MLTPYQTILECDKTTSLTAKQETIAANGSELLKKVLNYALDPFKVYGVKKYELERPLKEVENFSDGVMIHMFDVLEKLMKREVTGDAARQTIKDFSGKLSEQEQEVFARILNKDLRCGVAEGIVNKVFRKLIPEFEVQLAQPSKHLHKVKFPCIGQPKFDGVRTVAIVDPAENSITYYSRNGKEFTNFSCFNQELFLLARNNSTMFDGEVVGPPGKEFVSIMQQCRRKYDANPVGLIYRVFDWMPTGIFVTQSSELEQRYRSESLDELETAKLSHINFAERRVITVESQKINNEQEMYDYYNRCVEQGYEGVIIKSIDGEYEFKRSNNWVKIKPDESEDLRIVDIQEGRGKYQGLLGAIIVEREGVKINVGSGFKDNDRCSVEEAQKMIGKVAEVKYDSLTPDKSLRFPRFVQIREDK
jgi:DNA ligase-1